MPRTPKIEQHENYEEFKRLLLDKDAPAGIQREIAKKVGVSEQAISQYKKNLLTKVKKKAHEMIQAHKEDPQILARAELEINEVERLANNIARIEEIVGPLHSIVLKVVKDLQKGALVHLDVGLVHLVRSLLADSTKMLEASSKAKGKWEPEIQINIQFNEFKTQVLHLNEFVFNLIKEDPAKLKQYEEFIEVQQSG